MIFIPILDLMNAEHAVDENGCISVLTRSTSNSEKELFIKKFTAKDCNIIIIGNAIVADAIAYVPSDDAWQYYDSENDKLFDDVPGIADNK